MLLQLVLCGQAKVHRGDAEALRKTKSKPESAEVAEAAETQGLRAILSSLSPLRSEIKDLSQDHRDQSSLFSVVSVPL